jgi:hypothetical protein
MKVIISGSPTLQPRAKFEQAIQECGFDITEVVHGMRKGPSRLGFLWAYRNQIPTKEFYAHWLYWEENWPADKISIRYDATGRKYNAKAGINRDKEMVEYCDAAILIHENTKETINLRNLLRYNNKPYHEIIIGDNPEPFDEFNDKYGVTFEENARTIDIKPENDRRDKKLRVHRQK